MIKNKLIKDLKNITKEPRLALHFLYCLHFVNEVFCVSSIANNWKYYNELKGIVSRCNKKNTKSILHYLIKKKQELYSQIESGTDDDGKWYRVDKLNDLLLLKFADRVSNHIKNYVIEIKNIKLNSSWNDVYTFLMNKKILFLPSKNNFNNMWLKNICKTYQFFEFKINIFQIQNKKEIEHSFNHFCQKLNILNKNLGHNKLSVYFNLNYDDIQPSYYFTDANFMYLKNISHFTHEWAHYLDNTAYYDEKDFFFMVNNVSNYFVSDIINCHKKIKNQSIKYYCLYKILKKIIYGNNNVKKSKFYKFCIEYNKQYNLEDNSDYAKNYYYQNHEIFARFFEVCITEIIGNNMLVSNKNYYSSWKIYPTIKETIPLLDDLNKFIKLITNN